MPNKMFDLEAPLSPEIIPLDEQDLEPEIFEVARIELLRWCLRRAIAQNRRSNLARIKKEYEMLVGKTSVITGQDIVRAVRLEE